MTNVDGAISASPNRLSASSMSEKSNSMTFIGITLIDCIGRSFPYHKYLQNVDVIAYSKNSAIAEANYHERSGDIEIVGKKLGRTEVVVEVSVDGVLKARDVLPININVFILPSRPITVHTGDKVNFGIPEEAKALIKQNKFSSQNKDFRKWRA